MSGWDINLGTAVRVGCTFAIGKSVIAIYALERRFRNLFAEGMITTKVQHVHKVAAALK